MRRPSTLALLLPTVLLLSCGGASTSPIQAAAPTYLDLAGNWEFGLQLTAITSQAAPIEAVTGTLANSGSAVTATLRATPLGFSNCISPTTDLLATGTVDTAGNVTLTFPIAGGTGTITGNATPAPGTNYRGLGTYKVIGGGCAQSAAAVGFMLIPNVSGTYSGILNQIFPPPTGSALTSTVTVVVVQSTTPNTDGEYSLTGTVTSTGACIASFSFTQGIVFGFQVLSYPYPENPLPSGNTFLATAIPATNQNASQLFGATMSQPASCGAVTYEGTLN